MDLEKNVKEYVKKKIKKADYYYKAFKTKLKLIDIDEEIFSNVFIDDKDFFNSRKSY